MSIRSKEPEPSPLKDSILIILFLFQIYNTLGLFVEKKFHLSALLNESVQNNAAASMFIASTFFLATSKKPTTKQQKLATVLAAVLFVIGIVLSLAKSWLETNIESL